MLLVFLYFLIVIILFIILGIIFSKIEIDVNIIFDNIKLKNILYNFNIKLYLYKSLNILTIKIDENYLRIYKFKFNIKKIYLKIIDNINVENDIQAVHIDDIKKLNMSFSNIFLALNLSVINNIITMYAVSITSILISTLIGHLSFKTNMKNINIDIKPIFNMENILLKNKNDILNANLILKFLVSIKMINLIKFIYLVNKNINLSKESLEKQNTNE